MMNNRKKIANAAILAVLIIISCDLDDEEQEIFDFDLRGTWVSNDPSIYSGKLVIDIDRITITDFNEGQTPSGEDDNNRPFRNFTKGTALKGYSNEGKIFIKDSGILQEGIPYIYYTTDYYPQEKFIRFTFGQREEILKRIQY